MAVAPPLTPGAWVAVAFEDDPGYVYERILEWPIGPPARRCWIVLTPGGHEYAEAEADWTECFWLAGRFDDGYPPEVGDREMIPFQEPVSDSSMLKIIRRGRAQAPATQGGLKLAAAKVPTTWTSWEGVEHAMPPAGIGDRLRTRMENQSSVCGGVSASRAGSRYRARWLSAGPPLLPLAATHLMVTFG